MVFMEKEEVEEKEWGDKWVISVLKTIENQINGIYDAKDLSKQVDDMMQRQNDIDKVDKEIFTNIY